MPDLPPTNAPNLPPLPIAARRTVTLFGAPAELVLLPQRANRRDTPGAARPPFAPCRARTIVADEAIWQADGLAATPNRFPFLREQLLLWPTEPMRDPSLRLWQVAHAWVERTGGVGLLNNIGSAASIARAHVHLGMEQGTFLAALRRRRWEGALDLPAGVTATAADVPFCLLALEGTPERRAEAVWQLAEQRLTPAWNVVVEPQTTWVMPRSAERAAGFAAAVGAAEVWGRWCFTDEVEWRAASPEGLAGALVGVGC